MAYTDFSIPSLALMSNGADAQLDNALSVSTLLRGHEQQLAAKEAAKQKAEDDRLKRQDDELRRQDAAQVRTDSAAARAEKIRAAKLEQDVINALNQPGPDGAPNRSPQAVKNIIMAYPGSEAIVERHLRGGIAAQKAAIETQRGMVEAVTNELVPVLSIKDPVQQQAEWDKLRAEAIKNGLVQNEAVIPVKVDRDWIISKLRSFEGTKAHLDALEKELEADEKKKNPSVGDLDKWRTAIATEMGHARTPEDWARGRDALLKMPGFPDSMRGVIDVPFSSGAAENFLTKGLSPNEYFAHKDREAAARRAAAGGGAKGRNVTSGDAGRLTEFDSALSDASVIDEMLADNPEGTGWVPGTVVNTPGWVTQFTGLGEQEKARQATIDRVKQAIGKTLEGGVLRKEDEVKYTKILPTMSDQPEIALAKMRGLRAALEGKRSDFMANLEDAGYDVSRFRARDEQRKATEAAAVEAKRKDRAGEVNPNDDPPEAVKRQLNRAPAGSIRGDGTRGWVKTPSGAYRRVK
jgi:hypothetical protein